MFDSPQEFRFRKTGNIEHLVASKTEHPCKFCGGTFRMNRCHIKPKAWGGKLNFNNFIFLCQKCHVSFDRFVGIQLSSWPGGVRHP